MRNNTKVLSLYQQQKIIEMEFYLDLVITDVDTVKRNGIIDYTPYYSGDTFETEPKNALIDIETRQHGRLTKSVEWLERKGFKVAKSTEEEVLREEVVCVVCNGSGEQKNWDDFQRMDVISPCEHCTDGVIGNYHDLFTQCLEMNTQVNQ